MDLNQVTLPVSDMQQAVRFYIAMGFTLIVDTPHYARFSCPQGNSTFSLSLEDKPTPQGTVIYFETEKLEERCQELVAKGIQFEQPPTDQRYLWKEAILHDPSGNKIKLYYAGENRLNPPWRVESSAQK